MPHRLTLTKMLEAIRARKLSPVELVDAHLAQIGRINPGVNAFVMQFPSEARAAARRAELDPTSAPLQGIPVTVKDSFDVSGLPTLCGSRFRVEHRAARDATPVRRLRDAGAIVLGKTNCPEFLANYETDNHICGRTNNPWNLDYTAGGSSGGESAAIAALCSAGGIGSDGGGSIRIPAHFCGIAGLKPTPGRVPAVGHFPEISHPGGLLGVAGPMARTVEDTRLLFQVLAGHDVEDPFSAPVPLRPAVLDGLRVGILEQFPNIPVQPEIRVAVQKAAKCLAAMRIPVDEFAPLGIESAPDLWWFFFGELAAPFTREVIHGRESDSHWTGTELMEMVPPVPITAHTLVENMGARDRMRASLARQMESCPVVLMPACGVTAFPHRKRGWTIDGREIGLLEAMAPVTVFNLLGFPALAVPFDVTVDGLPVGVQLVARPYEEELLLELGVQLEQARGPFPLAPGVI